MISIEDLKTLIRLASPNVSGKEESLVLERAFLELTKLTRENEKT